MALVEPNNDNDTAVGGEGDDNINKVKVKEKFTLEQATKALNGGGRSTTRPDRFITRKDTGPIVEGAGWASGPVWTGADNLAPMEFDPLTVKAVASCYTD
jgi:hypothetical protein